MSNSTTGMGSGPKPPPQRPHGPEQPSNAKNCTFAHAPTAPAVLAEIKTLPPQVPSSSSLTRGSKRGGRGGARSRGGAQEKPAKPPKSPKKKRRTRIQDMWGNADGKRGYEASPKNIDDVGKGEDEAQEEEVEGDEDMAVVDTFADYKPAKLKIGKNHPDAVIETASMASVLPPNISYSLNLPEKVIDTGKLSALQLESITYACQQHNYDLQSGVRSGYLIGDGAGVGKGRTIAGIIYENWLQKRRKSLWISVSADLKFDTERDLRDIGASMIKVHPLNKLKYGKINQFHEGVIFATYSALIGSSKQGGKYNTRLKQVVKWCGNDFDGPIIFDECHRAKNLCPVGMKKPTKTGIAVQEIQTLLPRARIVYASATGASEPKNMAYMTRLGIWGEGTPFADFKTFLQAIETRGVGAMEVVAMDMKLRGAYIARQLSFKGVTFSIEKVPLGPEEVKLYDESVDLWVDALKQFRESVAIMSSTMKPREEVSIWAQFWGAHQRFFKYLCIASKVKKAVEIAKASVKEDKCVVIGLQSTGEARTLDQLERDDGELNDFVSTAKGVLQTLVEKQLPGRIPKKPSVHGLFSKSLLHLLDDEDSNDENEGPRKKRRKRTQATKITSRRAKLEDFDDEDSTDIEKDSTDFEVELDEDSYDGSTDDSLAIPGSDVDSWGDSDSENGNRFGLGLGLKSSKKKTTKGKGKKTAKILLRPSKADRKHIDEMKANLLEKIEAFGARLPQNSLDQLIDELGGPNVVAELTGRKGRVVQDSRGNVSYETRAENDISLETVNLKEKDRFMKGEKLIAIISEAASSGISLQSDRRAQNQRRRVHITLELPWSADRAIQQFGRTHRSNQVNAPEYIFLISDLAGEHRFASIVAKRLESLGALTHGDRRATESRDLSQFHIDNKYGRKALDSIFCGILDVRPPLVPPPKDFEGGFRKDLVIALAGVELVMELHFDSVTTDDKYTLLPDRSHQNMSKFLNRILGIPVRLQNSLFEYFIDSLAAAVKEAKKNGRYDAGILDLNSKSPNDIFRVRRDTYERRHVTGVGLIELHELKVERGLSWEEAMKKYAELNGLATEGFYVTKQMKNGKTPAILAISESGIDSTSTSTPSAYSMYSLYRPNTGMQWSRVPLWELREKNTKVTPEQARKSWEYQYNDSEKVCSHAYWSGNCKTKLVLKSCDYGLRQRTYHVLSGSVLLVWAIVEHVLQKHSHSTPKMQTIRVKFGEDERIVGVLIPNHCAQPLRDELQKGAVSAQSQGIGEMDVDTDAEDYEPDYSLDFNDAPTPKRKKYDDFADTLSLLQDKVEKMKEAEAVFAPTLTSSKVKKENENFSVLDFATSTNMKENETFSDFDFASSSKGKKEKADYLLDLDAPSLIYNALADTDTPPLLSNEVKKEKKTVFIFEFASSKAKQEEEDDETDAEEADDLAETVPVPASDDEDDVKTEPCSPKKFDFDPFAGLLD